MSGVVQEAGMIFAESHNDYGLCGALAELRTEIERYLFPLSTDDPDKRASRIAAAFAEVYRRLEEKR